MGLICISQNGTETPAKELGMRCNCKSKTTACSDLTEEERQEIFNYIWKLTWGEKRAFIQGLLEKCEPKRRYSKTETPPKKAFTWNYEGCPKRNRKRSITQRVLIR
ncbi:hypothetical protein PoB_002080400 [Plakobranchus ocellatus]|uniref:Uncharacterized protein n=1 Tax=Plakobranchus ocellatus TaxID=259542 RepID=A0AAV3ZKA0_9GAST|nr:hypothetical protein PoB_002080400 [Plakobranchus ocellatus]